MRTMTALLAMAALAWAGDTRDDSVRKLESMKVSVDFQDVRLPEALDYLRELTGLNLVVLPRALEKDGDAKVTLKVKDLSVKSVLKLLLAPRNLTLTYRDGALVVLPKDDLQDSTTMRMFDVRSMMVKLQDFAGPKVELAGPSKNGTSVVNAVFTLEEPKDPPIPEDFLITLIRENTGGGSWDSNTKSAINMNNGMLVVSQTPAVLREIEALLGLLGQYR